MVFAPEYWERIKAGADADITLKMVDIPTESELRIGLEGALRPVVGKIVEIRRDRSGQLAIGQNLQFLATVRPDNTVIPLGGQDLPFSVWRKAKLVHAFVNRDGGTSTWDGATAAHLSFEPDIRCDRNWHQKIAQSLPGFVLLHGLGWLVAGAAGGLLVGIPFVGLLRILGVVIGWLRNNPSLASKWGPFDLVVFMTVGGLCAVLYLLVRAVDYYLAVKHLKYKLSELAEMNREERRGAFQHLHAMLEKKQ